MSVLVLGRGLAFAITFVVPLILVQILEPAVFGTYRQLLLVFTTLYGIAQLGMAESLFYFVPSDPKSAGAYAGNALLTLAAVGVGLFVVLASLGHGLAAGLANPAVEGLAALVGIYLALMLASAPLEIILVSRGRHIGASAGYALFDVGRAVLTLLPALAWGRLDAMFAGGIVFAALRLATTLVVCRREFGGDFRIDLARIGTQLAYALPLQLAVALEIVQANLHAYIVSSRSDAATFAVYSLGCLQIPLVDLVAGSACSVMMVRMRDRVTREQPDAIMPVWRETTRKLALVLFPLVGVLWLVSRDLFSVLFPEIYAASVPVFRIWLGVLVLAAIPAHGPLRVLGDTRFLALQTLLKLLIVAVFTVGLMSAFGLPGAVLAALVAMLIGKSILLARLRHHAGVGLSQLLPWRSYAGIVAAGLAAIVPAAAVRSIAPSGVERLVLTGAIYLTAYAIIVWRSGLLEASEQRRLVTVARRLLSRRTDTRSYPVS